MDWIKLCSYGDKPRSLKLEPFELNLLEYIRNTTHLEKPGVDHFKQALLELNDTREFRYQYCRNKIRFDLSIIDIVMDSPKTKRYVQTLRVNLSDKLANLGINSIL